MPSPMPVVPSRSRCSMAVEDGRRVDLGGGRRESPPGHGTAAVCWPPGTRAAAARDSGTRRCRPWRAPRNCSRAASDSCKPRPTSPARSSAERLGAPALHRRGDAQRLAVFGDGSAGEHHALALRARPRSGRPTARSSGVSRSIMRLISWRIASALCACSPEVAAMAVVKKYLSGKVPCGVADILVGGGAADRALVQPGGLGDVAQHQRPQMLHAVAEERHLPGEDRLGHPQHGARPLVQRLGQPVRRLHALGQILLGRAARACGA